MTNMNPKKTLASEQDPLVCNHNFEEVILGYADEIAMGEMQRCLQRKYKPYISGRSVNIRIPGFIRCIIERDLEQAYHTIAPAGSLPTIRGRVCPQEI